MVVDVNPVVPTNAGLINSLKALVPPSAAIMDDSSARMLARALWAPAGSEVKNAGAVMGIRPPELMSATQDSKADSNGGFVATGAKADITTGSARTDE